MKKLIRLCSVAVAIIMAMPITVNAEIRNAFPTDITLDAFLSEDVLSFEDIQNDESANEEFDELDDELEVSGEDAEEVQGLTLPAIKAYGEEDIDLLAKLIWHESEAEPRDGKIAVAEVILNRINSSVYPNSVSDVIYQKGQFSHVSSVKNENPDQETRKIAEEVLNGELRVLNNSNVLYFRNPKKTSGINASEPKNWGRHKYFASYGNHAFYTHTPYGENKVADNSAKSSADANHSQPAKNTNKEAKISVASNKETEKNIDTLETSNFEDTFEIMEFEILDPDSPDFVDFDVIDFDLENIEETEVERELTEEERLKELHAEIEADRQAEVEAIAANHEATQAAVDAAVAQAIADEEYAASQAN